MVLQTNPHIKHIHTTEQRGPNLFVQQLMGNFIVVSHAKLCLWPVLIVVPDLLFFVL